MLQTWAENLKIGSDIDVVYWNNGLWDIVRLCGDEPLISASEYQNNLKKIVHRIQFLFPNAKIIFATTTPIMENSYENEMYQRKNSDILLYNEIAKSVMREKNVFVDDLYKLIVEAPQNLYLDGTHFSQKGNSYLAAHISEYILSMLTKAETMNGDIISVDIQRIKEKKIIIYGYGYYGEYVRKKLLANNIPILAIADTYKNGLVGNEMIINYDKMIEYCNNYEDITIVIAISDMYEFKKIKNKILKVVNVDIYHYSIIDLV